jgi:hypothetical protein
MSEHLRRAPNPKYERSALRNEFCNNLTRATPTMQASNRLTFKFWSMLTGRCDVVCRVT